MPRLRATIHDRGRAGFFVALGLATIAAAAFWGPAIPVGRGWFPAPLDDVYIHFDFARSLGQGYPFQWIPGQGYSSGETAPLYAAVLAIGHLIGFRGRALGLWAAIVALLSVASLLGSTRRLARPAPAWLAWLVALFPVSIGVVDWALFSGMEVALFTAALGRALEALQATRDTSRRRPTLERRQWRLGAWGVALVLLRPEAAILVAIFALAGVRGVGRRSALLAFVRTSVPGAVGTTSILGLNRLATGDARSAGAQLKLLSSNPYMSDEDRARVFVENLVTFWVKVVRGELGALPALALLLPLLAVPALARRSTRALASTCLLAALAWTLLVSWNGNAPHHNFRYYVPALVMVAIAAGLGVAALARRLRVVPGILAVTLLASLGARLPTQARHFRSSSANIRDQHVEVGERIGRLPASARVLLGDAGAIPYVSGRTAVDALGLGGYRRVPFAHAAVHGEAATIELIERLPPELRPTHFALYPNWFGALTSRFGVEIERVTIEGNVICGSPTKAIYRADWSALATSPEPLGPEILEEIDIGDVLAESEHGYVAPLPHGGWTTLDILDDSLGQRRFDGGRTIPDGKSESFVVHRSTGAVELRVRVDAGARRIVARTDRGAMATDLILEPPRPGAWRSGRADLVGLAPGDRITLTAAGGEYKSYHVWLAQGARAVR